MTGKPNALGQVANHGAPLPWQSVEESVHALLTAPGWRIPAIVREMERSGAVDVAVLSLTDPERKDVAVGACYKLIALGRTEGLFRAIRGSAPVTARLKLLEMLLTVPTQELVDVLHELAMSDNSAMATRAARALPFVMEKLLGGKQRVHAGLQWLMRACANRRFREAECFAAG